MSNNREPSRSIRRSYGDGTKWTEQIYSRVRVSTNLTEQVSRRFPGDSRRDFKKIQDMFALLRPVMQCTKSTSLPKYRTKTWYAQHGAVAKIKRVTSFLNKRSSAQFYRDWKPIKSIIDILHKNFQDDHTNSRRFPGFPRGFLNSSRFQGFPGVIGTLRVGETFTPPRKWRETTFVLESEKQSILRAHWQHSRFRHLSNVYFLFADLSAVVLETECPSLLRCVSV